MRRTDIGWLATAIALISAPSSKSKSWRAQQPRSNRPGEFSRLNRSRHWPYVATYKEAREQSPSDEPVR